MSVWGISTVKDEADVIAGTLRHTADEVDHLLVVDNGSTDGTSDILNDLKRDLPLTVIFDPEIGYHQSVRMSRLAEQAARNGAEFIVPFDADEIWYSRLGRIREVLALTSGDVVTATLINHFCTSIDPGGSDPFVTMRWRQPNPAPLPKVAFRWRDGAVIHQGNHGVTLPGPVAPIADVLELRHFPYRSAEQFVRKSINGARAYAHTSLPPDQGAHWRAYGAIADRHGEEALAEVFREHFWYLSPLDAGLVEDPAPYLRWHRH